LSKEIAMPLVTADDAVVHETPNAVMTTVAAPSLGSARLAAWEVRMRPGQRGPQHTTDQEQVWVVLDGAAHVVLDGEPLVAGAGDTAILPAGASRAIAAPDGLRALVTTIGGAQVHTAEGGQRPLPWAI
jgi:quercetin dioxygenase-like cupin family protein